MQTISSKNTALHHLPALHKSKIVLEFLDSLFTKYVRTNAVLPPAILDYGAGKSVDFAREHFGRLHALYTPYDPYYDDYNDLDILKPRYDIVLCSNVLNVIDDLKEIRYVIDNCYLYLRKNGKAFIKVYEGDKSGRARMTTKGFQRNQPTDFYYQIAQEQISRFPKTSTISPVEKKGKIIVISNDYYF